MTGPNLTHTRPGRAAAGAPHPGIGSWLAAVILAEAATFGAASYLHADGTIPLGFTTVTGEHFPDAALPELIIGTVLAAGAVAGLVMPAWAARLALAVTGFAIAGTSIGIAALLGSGRPDITADLTYHGAIMAALLATFTLLLLRRPASRRAPGR